ncbi:histidinol-phosphate transaminase [Terfezia boudieri ATCC MYA-4762]|uniref:histidinol-phosphate transaminase n=1 Tax=Terfezia boudieri ATCC MYA-4762 TaxID=1051890 RepID=A0A3N4LYQ1_9PEZI|nr:histidinol-phosphate transaminase [Terfezia boudieri ATCC MYA-4762]
MASRPFNIQTCARPNILKLVPYRCARDDYKDDGTNILLDANENSYGPSLPLNGDGKLDGVVFDLGLSKLNRYPDPHQIDLKKLFCNLRNRFDSEFPPLTPANLFVGVGSDECIDALLRCFCVPAKSKILTCPPTYGMYTVSAHINDLTVVPVPLDLTPGAGFPLRPDAINEALSADPDIKIVYICSPGNPTGALVHPEHVKAILDHPTWNGVLVVDEAYVDFAADGSSLAPWVPGYPNFVVMQTLSKAFGLAGIRLGVAFASPEVAQLLNNLKAPYSISSPTSILASTALKPEGLAVMQKHVSAILTQRQRLLEELSKIPGIGRFLGGIDANFLLLEVLDAPNGKPDNGTALKLYEGLAETKGIVVRFRGKEAGCNGCLRISIGTETENTKLLEKIRDCLASIHAA